MTYVTEVQLGRPCYRVEFSDGESIVCDAEHLWTVDDRDSRRNPLTSPRAECTRECSSSTSGFGRNAGTAWDDCPVACPDTELDIDPYVLGYWLGDGSLHTNLVTVHADDAAEVAAEFRRLGECATYGLRRKTW